MKCIDGVEGVLSRVLEGQCKRFVQGEINAMDYALFARGLIEDSAAFVAENQELGVSPALFSDVLYDMARSAWLSALEARKAKDGPTDADVIPEEGYGEYFFDFIFRNRTYPG